MPATILGSMFQVDASAARPPFEQLKDQVVAAITSGELREGDRMPTVRALAQQLGLAVNTVARSYRELEADRLIETRGRAGTVVAFSGDQSERLAQAAARTFADRIRELGVDAEAALELVARALRG